VYQAGRPPIPYLLAYAGTLAVGRADRALRPHGLTVRQFGLLAQLHLEPELTMSELARQLGVSRQALYDLVSELERAGHLRRLPGASGRTRKLALAPGTGRLLARAQRALAETEAELVGGLNPRATEALRGLLQHLLAQATDDETWLSGL
jgi:DNA-binding MarR family transcriptional regulator